jgi:hypothetical protein
MRFCAPVFSLLFLNRFFQDGAPFPLPFFNGFYCSLIFLFLAVSSPSTSPRPPPLPFHRFLSLPFARLFSPPVFNVFHYCLIILVLAFSCPSTFLCLFPLSSHRLLSAPSARPPPLPFRGLLVLLDLYASSPSDRHQSILFHAAFPCFIFLGM